MFINIMTTPVFSPSNGSAMPVSVRERVLPVRLVSVTGVASAAADQKTVLMGTDVCGYSNTVDAIEGAFPGTSAWSPPN